MRCDQCGFENDPSATRCHRCGNMLALTSEQVERAWLEPEPERPPPWMEPEEPEEPKEEPAPELEAVWGDDEPAPPSFATHELPPAEPPSVPVAMPAPPPPPPPPVEPGPPRRDRWPAVRRVLLGLEIVGALAFAVLAYLEGSYDYLYAAVAFGALPFVYLIVAAIRGAGSRALTVPVALVLAGVVGFSAFIVITDCENRLEPGGNLSGCDLTGLDLAGLDLSGADLSGATLARAKLAHARLRDADLTEANLRGADASDVVFDGADLTGADLRETQLDLSTFTGAVLAEANLGGLQLDGQNFAGLDLHGADLTGASLGNVNLERANLEEAVFEDATMAHATLDGAKLARARLVGATLTTAGLQGADLTEADLAGADLGKANLNDATLTDVTITGTTLDGATLIGATGLSDAQLADGLGVGLGALGAELAERAIRLQARDEILRTLGVACGGRGVDEAAELGGSGRHLLVLGGPKGGVSPISAKPAQLKWEPMAARFGQLVACAHQEEAITVELCQYFVTGSGAPGPPTRRLRFERRVRVVEARTGKVLSDVTHSGSLPGSCPFTKTTFGTGGEDRIEGSHIGFDAFKSQLAGHVNP